MVIDSTLMRMDPRTSGVVLSSRLRGTWCLIALSLPSQLSSQLVRVALDLNLASAGIGETYLRPTFGCARLRTGLLYLPDSAESLRVELFGNVSMPKETVLQLQPISRAVAAALIAMRHPFRLFRALVGGRGGLPGRLRAALSSLSAGTASASYSSWIELFDTWCPVDHAGLLASPRRNSWPAIGVCVLSGVPGTDQRTNCAGSTPGALKATEEVDWLIRSLWYLIASWANPPVQCHLPTLLQNWIPSDVALLQAGEVLPSHALALLADQIVTLGRPPAVYADEDEITLNGTRHDPLFKPEPNHALMLSGTLSRGVWLVRRDLLSPCTGDAVRWAETLRLELWLLLYERGEAGNTRRVPFVLTHRRPDAQAAPPADLASVVSRHLGRMGMHAHLEARWPLRVEIIAEPKRQPKVSIVVPSACRRSHVLRCLRAVLAKTRYADFELVVVVAQETALDEQQCGILRVLSADPRFRYMNMKSTNFNYSAANNAAVGATAGSLVCLLNDDVEPRDPDWLARMVGHLLDPRVGVVGARLEYPNRLVQHGGVIMGVAGLCDHANQFLPANRAGYAWRGVLDQEVSAVTGACLLVRRELFDALGGLDESYASAFNDVDFCLRIREAGHSVVLCATTQLIHYESLSFGRHYAVETEDREVEDVRRMRARWAAVCAADPFHNPNLSLQRGNEWTFALPPRVDKPPA